MTAPEDDPDRPTWVPRPVWRVATFLVDNQVLELLQNVFPPM